MTDGRLVLLAETVLQMILTEADVDGLIGVGRYERSGERHLPQRVSRERHTVRRFTPLRLSWHRSRQDKNLSDR